MKTEHLIDMLSTNLEPVKDHGQLRKALLVALVVGGAASFSVMLATVGLRPEASGFRIEFLTLKVLFMLILIGAGTALLAKLIRPGQDARALYTVIFLAFLAIGLAGLVGLAVEPPTAWHRMVFGTQWVTCLYCIPLFSIVPFALLIWALRSGAPTHLKRTGAIAGLVAGALGATAYAFHCADDSLPFIALWYGVMVMLCGLIGAALGPRLLRW